MGHYRIAIVAHFEQKDDCAPWRAYQDLKLAGHAVEMVELRQCRGLVVEGELDREALRPFEEVFKPDYVAWQGETAEEILQALAGLPEHEGPAPRHFVVDGWVGKDNFGDEFLFKTICDRLRRDWPGCWVSLVGQDPTASLARHGVAGAVHSEKAQINAMLNGASALIFMGGILLDFSTMKSTAGPIELFFNPGSTLPGQAALCQIAALNEVPAVFLGIGAGPLGDEDACRLMRLESLSRPRYIARDAQTERLLLEAGVDGSLVSRGADLAYAADYPPEAARAAAGRIVGELAGCAGYAAFALREQEPHTAGIEAAAAEAADRLFEERGLGSVLLAFDPADAPMQERILGRMRHPQAALSLGTEDFEECCGVLGGADLVVCMRLHGSIIAAAQGVPGVGLAYNVKVGEAYRQLGMEDFLLSVDATGDELAERCLALADGREEASRRMAEGAAEARRLAEGAFEELRDIVDAHEPAPHRQASYPRSVSQEALRRKKAQRELREARGQLQAAQAENAELKARLEEAEASAGGRRGRRRPGRGRG